MPNWVTTIVVAPENVLDSLATGDTAVDFKNILPCPPDDDPMFTAKRTDFGDGISGWSFHGYSPLDWMRENWGTKWNASDSKRVNDNQVEFKTAWSTPHPVLSKLMNNFPDADILVVWADEDVHGDNHGYVYRLGGLVGGSTEEKTSADFARLVTIGEIPETLHAETGWRFDYW